MRTGRQALGEASGGGLGCWGERMNGPSETSMSKNPMFSTVHASFSTARVDVAGTLSGPMLWGYRTTHTTATDDHAAVSRITHSVMQALPSAHRRQGTGLRRSKQFRKEVRRSFIAKPPGELESHDLQMVLHAPTIQDQGVTNRPCVRLPATVSPSKDAGLGI